MIEEQFDRKEINVCIYLHNHTHIYTYMHFVNENQQMEISLCIYVYNKIIRFLGHRNNENVCVLESYYICPK